MESYKDFAYIYDKLMHEDIDYGKWCDYIENLFAAHGVEPKSIYELACGTGNMTSELSRRGYKMSCSDLSADMIAVARRKVKNAEFKVCNMSKTELDKEYDAFICMIDGINYVIAPKNVLQTFKRVKKYLKDGGVFIFDISSRYKLENILGNETYIHSDCDIFYSWQNRYIEKYNLCDMLLNFFVRNGEMYERFEERHIQRGYSESEIRLLLKKAGFKEIDVYGELSFEKPHFDSQRLVFVCR